MKHYRNWVSAETIKQCGTISLSQSPALEFFTKAVYKGKVLGPQNSWGLAPVMWKDFFPVPGNTRQGLCCELGRMAAHHSCLRGLIGALAPVTGTPGTGIVLLRTSFCYRCTLPLVAHLKNSPVLKLGTIQL